jgi:hypothetical protein
MKGFFSLRKDKLSLGREAQYWLREFQKDYPIEKKREILFKINRLLSELLDDKRDS